MAKDNLYQYDSTAANNLDVGGISVAEGMLPSGVNNAIRELMSHQKDFVTGAYLAGTGNVALGDAALSSGSLSGDYNTAVGSAALRINTTGTSNLSLGAETLYDNTTGSNNTAVGRGALRFNTTASDNTAIGKDALFDNTTGASNTALGRFSLANNTTASNNTAVGYQAGYANTTGTRNTVLGSGGLFDNTTGNNNTAIGWNVLANNTTASHNVGIGAGDAATYNPALAANTTGQYNTAVGNGSLGSNTTASNNTAVGYQAGYSNTTGTYNVFLGQQAGYTNTTANGVTAVGFQALKFSTGAAQTALGESALYNSTGTYNTAVGYNAGVSITTGSKNTIIGGYTGNSGGLDIRTSSNNIVLSDGDGNPRGRYSSSPARWEFDVGQAGSTSFYIKNLASSSAYGIFQQFANCAPDNNTNYIYAFDDSVARRFVIYSDGDVVNHDNSYGAISDVKLKEQITDASSQWDDIKALTVRKYKMKSDVTEKGDSDDLWRLGVVAQEVETAGMSGLVSEAADRDADNNDLGTTTKQVKYSVLYMKAVKALQEAMERIETLEAKVAALETN